MKWYTPLILAVLFLLATQPPLRAQDSAEKTVRALAEINRLGGKVEVDTNKPDRPVIGVNLSHTRVVDASLEHFSGLTRLGKLLLENTDVSDDGLASIQGLTQLEALELARTKVTDRGLKNLKGFVKLQSLNLEGTEVTDKGLEDLAGLPQLKVLSLENVRGVSDLGLLRLKVLISLRKLNLAGTRVTEAGVRDLQKALPETEIIRSFAPACAKRHGGAVGGSLMNPGSAPTTS